MIELPSGKRILVLCAHPDDDVFGMGASILEMTRSRSCKVTCAFLTTSPRGVPGDLPSEEKGRIRINEAKEACSVVGAETHFFDFEKQVLENSETIEKVADYARQLNPEVIFTLPSFDAHPTHAKTYTVASEVARELGLSELWIYEAWTPLRNPDAIHFFGEDEMKIKEQAMKKHASQLERQGPTDEAFVCLNRFRAIMIREPLRGFGEKHPELGRYAEVFRVEKVTGK